MEDKISVMYSEEEIDKRIRELGKQISEEYAGESIHMVCVLKGASTFACELAKRITIPVYFDFIKVSSYGNDTVSSGNIKVSKDVDDSVEGDNLLIIEDIVDSGRTLACLLELFKERNPKSLKLAVLLDKPDRRVIPVNVDYTGFVIPDEFVVGYGLDYAQKYRNLPYVGIVEQ